MKLRVYDAAAAAAAFRSMARHAKYEQASTHPDIFVHIFDSGCSAHLCPLQGMLQQLHSGADVKTWRQLARWGRSPVVHLRSDSPG